MIYQYQPHEDKCWEKCFNPNFNNNRNNYKNFNNYSYKRRNYHHNNYNDFNSNKALTVVNTPNDHSPQDNPIESDLKQNDNNTNDNFVIQNEKLEYTPNSSSNNYYRSHNTQNNNNKPGFTYNDQLIYCFNGYYASNIIQPPILYPNMYHIPVYNHYYHTTTNNNHKQKYSNYFNNNNYSHNKYNNYFNKTKNRVINFNKTEEWKDNVKDKDTLIVSIKLKDKEHFIHINKNDNLYTKATIFCAENNLSNNLIKPIFEIISKGCESLNSLMGKVLLNQEIGKLEYVKSNYEELKKSWELENKNDLSCITTIDDVDDDESTEYEQLLNRSV